MKDTCYRDGVKRRNDIVEKITFIRSYSKNDNTEWQDWQQNCRVQNCSCKAPPTPTLTPSKSPTPTKTPTPSPTTVPGAWIKLKNASYYSNGRLTDNIPSVPIAYDGEDNTNPYFIIGANNGHGLVAASSINLTAINSSAKPNGTNRFASGYKGVFSMTPDSFKAYVTARKEHRSISSIASINVDGIYLWTGESPPTIDDTNRSRFDGRKVVFISPKSITINATVFSPNGGSVAFVSPLISLNKDTREVNGIFIANEITTGLNNSQGLKVVGNLVASQNKNKAASNGRQTPAPTAGVRLISAGRFWAQDSFPAGRVMR